MLLLFEVHMKQSLSIYIHIPFCKSKCTYCAFSSFAMGEEMYPIYMEALLKEIRMISPEYHNKRKLESIFFGGGTPSLLDPKDIEMILKELQKFFDFDDDLEITMESNPDTVDEMKIAAYKNLGINRMSFGVQSFRKKDMTAVNRNYDPKIIPEVIELAAKYIGNVSLDLIFALPGQTLKVWKENLEKAVLLPITHLSTYELMYEEGTALTQQQHLLKKLSENSILKMYKMNNELLPKEGFNHYEISNWYRTKPCKHNLLFWRGEDYLGFGLSAESLIDGNSMVQTKNLKSYLENPVSQRRIHHLQIEEQATLFIQNRLRLISEGIDREIFKQRFGLVLLEQLENKLKRYPEFIEKQGYRYVIKTDKYMLLDSILSNIGLFG